MSEVGKRPKSIGLIAMFLLAATAIASVLGTSLLIPSALLNRIWELNKPAAELFHSLGWVGGAFLLGLSGGTFFAALGLLRGKRWAWWFSTVLFTIDAVGDVISLVITRDLVRGGSGAIISFAFLYALSRPHVRGYFQWSTPHN